jgi:hypothetical protein
MTEDQTEFREIEWRDLGDGRSLFIYEENGVRKEDIVEFISASCRPPVKAETLEWRPFKEVRGFIASTWFSPEKSIFTIRPETHEGRPCWEMSHGTCVWSAKGWYEELSPKYAWNLEDAKAWCQKQAQADFIQAQNLQFETDIRRIWNSDSEH